MERRNVVAIGIDPGLTGACAALSLQPRAMALRCAVGTDGYYRGTAAGRLSITTTTAVLQSLLADLQVQGVEVNASEVWGMVEQPGLWDGRRQGAARISRVSADQRTWRNALELRCDVLLPDMQAQKIDRRAGLRRSTVGRAGRKAEVRAYNLQQVQAGTLPPFVEVPPGCRTVQDGLHDAVIMALAVLRTGHRGAL